MIGTALAFDSYQGTRLQAEEWEAGSYAPTPTIVDAARALYARHGVGAITQNDAKEMLTVTTEAVESIVASAQSERFKAIVFVTGVPGAGKTLVGLNTATRHADSAGRREERARKTGAAASKIESAFLSGNGPLVEVLRESLALDKRSRAREEGRKTTLDTARREIRSFIQNVHEFRDAYFTDPAAPDDRVVVFDEAQRAWNARQTAKFMRKKHGKETEWNDSEPEFLISCMDRHRDWAVIVCLVGGGQEINTGEAGISEWIDAVQRRFSSWRMFLSPHLHDSEYAAGGALERAASHAHVRHNERLHLAVSMRSFRAKGVSAFVKHMLDLDRGQAEAELRGVQETDYPIVLTRSLKDAKKWLRQRARGSERFGLLASSSALRLRPLAIDTRPKFRPAHWFLKDRDDVRSSYFLEDVATEFHVQGLELDYAAVVWDGDLRIADGAWDHNEFKGNRWLRVKQTARRMYLKNAYRVLLTRARQGMVIVVPPGSKRDKTRSAEFYDGTFEYLRGLGLPELRDGSVTV